MELTRKDSGMRIVWLTLAFAGVVLSAVVLGMFYQKQLAFAGGSLRYDGSSFSTGLMCGITYNMATGTYDWSSGGNTCTFSCDAAHNGQSCSVTSTIGSGTYDNCTGFTVCSYYICQTDNYTCVYAAACTPNSSCAADTYSDQTCTDSCGNVYQGTKPRSGGCADVGNLGNPACIEWGFSCSSMGMVGTWPVCVNPPTTCTASNACAASTAVGSTCTDSCGNSYNGTMVVYSQSYYQATYSPGYSQSYYQSSYYSEASYAPSCTSPTVSITATPSRVKSGQTSTLTVTASGITGTCTVTGPGVSQTYNASSCNVSGTITTPAITARSNYTVSCDSGAATAKVSVSIPFGILEF